MAARPGGPLVLRCLVFRHVDLILGVLGTHAAGPVADQLTAHLQTPQHRPHQQRNRDRRHQVQQPPLAEYRHHHRPGEPEHHGDSRDPDNPSWPDLFATDRDEIDEATESILTLFVGVMVGVQFAQSGVTQVSAMIAAQVMKTLPQKALTKGALYPFVKKVAQLLGVQMTKKLFASGVAKAIPLAGAVLSGTLTLATFLPMSKKLQKHLASLELTRPGHWRDAPEETDPPQ